MAGTAADNVGVTIVKVVNSVDGVEYTCTGTTSWHYNGLPLFDGRNTIKVMAFDAAGNAATATVSVSYGIWPMVYAAVFDNPEDVDAFRAYRDSILTSDPIGKAGTECLYNASEDALAALQTNPELTRAANSLVNANIDAIMQALAGGTGIVDNTSEVIDFLGALAEKTSGNLRDLALNAQVIIRAKQAKNEPFLGLFFKPIKTPPSMMPCGGVSVTTRRPDFEWVEIPDASSYEIWIQREGLVHTRVLVNAPPWKPLVGLPDGRYRWQVRPWTRKLGFGEWSATAEFTVDLRK